MLALFKVEVPTAIFFGLNSLVTDFVTLGPSIQDTSDHGLVPFQKLRATFNPFCAEFCKIYYLPLKLYSNIHIQ